MQEGKKETFITMYHGGIMRGRGIETLIKLLNRNPNIVAVILGDGEKEYVESLKQLARDLGVQNRTLFHSAVKLCELWKYVGAADVGMILAPAVCQNHLYSLPNKFFENIQSGTPLICPHYPAMKELVERYDIGLTCDPENMEEINSCVEKMRLDQEFYRKCKRNVLKAKKDLCWEKEKQVLLPAYEACLG